MSLSITYHQNKNGEWFEATNHALMCLVASSYDYLLRNQQRK